MVFGRAVWVSGVVALCCACGGESDSEGDSSEDGTGGRGATSSGGTSSGGNAGTSSGGNAGTSSGGNAGTSSGTGTVTDEWRAYCVARFTTDYDVIDVFDDPVFTAHVGEEYLMMAYPNPFSDSSNSATLAYLTPDGPYEFDVEGPAATPGTPFTANCPADISTEYYAVFIDTSVYAEETLLTKLCDLEAGTTLPVQSGSATGFGLADSTAESAVYEIFLNAFSAQCGGAERGFVSVPQIEVLGINTYLVPIRPIVGPP